jgi:ribosome biogenesis protein Nip4
MIYLASTRFKTHTWEQNINYKNKNNISGVIYGVPLEIFSKYPLNCIIFVIEMNNDTNEIFGIGLIRNKIITDKKYNIYDCMEYNRFIYKGDFWISREQINRQNINIVEILENILFKKKSHVKRQSGISIIKSKLLLHWKDYPNHNENYLKENIKKLFVNEFIHQQI